MAISPWWAGEFPAVAMREASAPAGTIAQPVVLPGQQAGIPTETAGSAARSLFCSGPPLVRLYSLPSPCPDSFEVDFWLTETADVQLDLFDARGRKVLGVIRRGLAGNCPHRLSLMLEGLNLRPDHYTCQLRLLKPAEPKRGS